MQTAVHINDAWLRRTKRAITSKINREQATFKIAGNPVDLLIDRIRLIGVKGSNSMLSSGASQLLRGLRMRYVEFDGSRNPKVTKWPERTYTSADGVDELIWVHDIDHPSEGHGRYCAWAGDHRLTGYIAERVSGQVLQVAARHFHVMKGDKPENGWLETHWPEEFEKPGTFLVEQFYADKWGWSGRASFALSFFGTQTSDPVKYPIGPHGSGLHLRDGLLLNDLGKYATKIESGALLLERHPFAIVENVRFELENTGSKGNNKPLAWSDHTPLLALKNSHFRCSRFLIDGAAEGLTIDGCDGGSLVVIDGKKHKTFDALQQPFQV